jgi:hypothetical protein
MTTAELRSLPPSAALTTDQLNRLICHAQLATGVIMDAARGTRDDIENPAQSIVDQAAYICEALSKISNHINRDQPRNSNVYISGHYAGD